MRQFIFILSVVGSLAGCEKAAVKSADAEPKVAHYKAGHGVGLPEEMKAALGVKVVEVFEQKFTPRISISLHVLHGMDGVRPVSSAPVTIEACGWLTSEQAGEVRPGQEARLLLPDGQTAAGLVQRVEKTTMGASGEYEVTISSDAPLETGTSLIAILEGSLTGEVVTVPASALMKTAEGEFVYVVNEEYFKRIPVKTGVRNEQLVEIRDGLYAGDQIVVSQITPLWMTELQTLRAGQSCCAGH